MVKLRSQYEQSAAPPAMVPNRNGLISIIFLTVPEPDNQVFHPYIKSHGHAHLTHFRLASMCTYTHTHMHTCTHAHMQTQANTHSLTNSASLPHFLTHSFIARKQLKPNMYGIPMYEPMLARESTAISTPCLNTKPNVVVPWLNLISGCRGWQCPSVASCVACAIAMDQ